MKLSVITLLAMGLLLFACDEPTPHVVFDEVDSTKIEIPKVSNDNYEGTIPGMDAKVIDYTLPNPYQHKPQLFRDSTIATSWDDAGFPNAKYFVKFFKTFQWDVMDRNKEKIAGMIQFPLRDFKDKKTFMSKFDSIFAPDFVEEILNQDPMEIYRDKKGAMIGDDGQIWFRMIKGKYKITEINP
ncbi:MAG: hypothetical protein K9H61_04565 [Bacteroidia bacterium]|nr:hypothetical protein [Bacteroidia bacterium]MCF8426208.1 hypothetical protein [Bacteroidia bacterium]MCF8446250.1 hypothetical protein [Bacteroidia bacterium]